MVLINLSKLILLIKAVKSCPSVIPGRSEKLLCQYLDFDKKSDDKVSVEVPAELEKINEMDLDNESDERKKKIVFCLIDQYTNSSFTFPDQPTDLHLVSPLEICDRCSGTLIFTRSGKKLGKGATVYTVSGPRPTQVYVKHCTDCFSSVYSSYTEWKENDVLMRQYAGALPQFFSVTQDSFFEIKLLEDLTESVFTCSTRFTRWVEKYNRVHMNTGGQKLEMDRFELYRQRIFPVWIVYSIHKKLKMTVFPVLRSSDRNLDIEAICCDLYPHLKQKIDSKWLHHVCHKCKSRIVIMDGDQKVYRTRCSWQGEKIASSGNLNQFTACAATPLPGKIFCQNHLDSSAETQIERLDVRITRQRRKELGLDLEELTTSEGCRKRECITQQAKRSKTAGMTYCFRPCGISLGELCN